MNPRDRVLAALHRQPVDRVPVMEMGIDWTVMRGLGYSRYLDMVEGLDLDGVCVNQALYFLGWRRFVLPRAEHYTDEWGVRSRFTGELMPIPVRHPVSELGDLKRFRPPRPERNPLLRAIRHIRRQLPNRAITMISRNDFAASWFLCGMDVLLMSFVDDPELATSLARMVSDYYTELYRLCIKAGVDVVYLTDDYAFKTGTLFSREHFERFVLPFLRRGVEAVKNAGGIAVKHTDGNISSIVDLVVGTGIDAIGPLEPDAGNDLVEFQQRWGDKVAVVGNVDVDLLCRGEPHEVEAVTRDLVRALAPAGGHVLSSGNTITSSVNPKNFLTMVKTAKSVAGR